MGINILDRRKINQHNFISFVDLYHFMEETDENPLIDLVEKRKKLRRTIKSEPEEAWHLLQEDPAMVLALTRVKQELADSKDENTMQFFQEYHKHVDSIFADEYPIDKYGIALATEFLTEYWRQRVSSVKMTSVNEAIAKKMQIFIEAAEQLPEGYEKAIISRIVDYSSIRVLEFADYDRSKAKSQLPPIKNEIDQFVSSVISSNKIHKLMAISYFASSSTEALEVFRDYMAKSLLEQLRPKFDDLDEDDKYKIAPYLGVFNEITKSDDEQVESN